MSTYTILPKDDNDLAVTLTTDDQSQVIVVDSATQQVTVTENTIVVSVQAGTTGSLTVDSVNTKTGIVVLNTDDILDTTQTNKYFTAAASSTQFNVDLATKTSDNLTEGSTNKYSTDANIRSAISGVGDINFSQATGEISFDGSSLVTSVNGQDGAVTLTTSNIAEGSRLYYTNARFDGQLASKTTDNLTEGGSRLYFTNPRTQTQITLNTEQFIKAGSTETLTNKSGNISQWSNNSAYVTDVNGVVGPSPVLNTDNIQQGASPTNKWFTQVLARGSIEVIDAGGDGSLTYNNATGKITYTGPSPSDVRTLISVTNTAGGDGLLSYDNSTGVITYTGPTPADVRAHFSAGEGIDISASGVISGEDASDTNKGIAKYNTNEFTVASGNVSIKTDGIDETHIDFGTGANQVSTADLPEQTNLYYTDVRANAAIDNRVDKPYVDALNIKAASVDPNSVTLGTDTTGNYVATVTGTASEVEVTGSGTETSAVTVGLPADVTISRDLVVTRNLTVQGTTTTVDTDNLLVKDNVLVINTGSASVPAFDSGLLIDRGASDNAAIIWDESADNFTLGTTTATGATTDPITVTKGTLNANLSGNVTGDLTGNVTGNTSGNAGTVTNGVYTTDTGTVTNTMLAGSIANAKLSNSALTIGSTAIPLGTTATTITGLASVTSTALVGNLTGNVAGDSTGIHTGQVIGTTVSASSGFSGALSGNVTGNLTGNVDGDVTGDLTGNSAGVHTGNVSGNITGDVAGNLTGNVTGNVTSSGTSTFSTVNIDGGNIDGTAIGATSASSGKFTTLETTGNITANLIGNTNGTHTGPSVGNVTGDVTGDVLGDVTGDLTGASNGTHTGPVIGTTVSASAGLTGTLVGNVTGDLTGNVTGNVAGNLTGKVVSTGTGAQKSVFTEVDINGGTIDNTPIGANVASTGTFTNVTTSGTISSTGVITGNVTGNLTGNSAGVHTGNVTGNVTGNLDGIIGANTPAVITGTVITGTSLVGPLTGNVTGNTNGIHTGTVIGNVTGQVSDLSNLSTTNLSQGTNLYYTDAQVLTKINATSIDALSDVDTTTAAPTGGQVLTWVVGNAKWEPTSTGIGDVTLTGAQTLTNKTLETPVFGSASGTGLQYEIESTRPTRGLLIKAQVSDNYGILSLSPSRSGAYTIANIKTASSVIPTDPNYGYGYTSSALAVASLNGVSNPWIDKSIINTSIGRQYDTAQGTDKPAIEIFAMNGPGYTVTSRVQSNPNILTPAQGTYYSALPKDNAEHFSVLSLTGAAVPPSSTGVGNTIQSSSTHSTNGAPYYTENALDIKASQITFYANKYQFPTNTPTVGQVLGAANGSGYLQWVSSSGTVSSVNNKTGAVVLNTDDVLELASPTNKYFTDARVETKINLTNLDEIQDVVYTTAPTAGQVLLWDSSVVPSGAWRPNTVSGTGTVTSVASGTGLTGGPITAAGTLNVDVGTTPGKIVQFTTLGGGAAYPAVDGSLITNLPSSGVTSIIAGTGLTGGTITSTGTINVDVGTTANKIVQLDSSAKLPAIDGSLLTNLPSGAVDQTLTFSSPNLTISGSGGNSVDLSSLTPSSMAWSSITSTPTTIAGYGITDAFNGAFSSLTSKPTTISGYGITDAFDGAFSSLTSKPTTISGYGITDGTTLTGTETLTNKTLTSPYINEIKNTANVGSSYNFTPLKFSNFYDPSLSPKDFTSYNGAFHISNYTDGVSDAINVWQLQTSRQKNILRLDAYNQDRVDVNGIKTPKNFTAGNFISGKTYKIVSVGTTDFTAIGSPNNNVNQTFIATGVGSGTGTADIWDTGSQNVLFGLKGADDIGFQPADSGGLVNGVKYKIWYVGTTDFTAVGAANNNVGTEFIDNGAVASSGTGIAVDMRASKGTWNQFSSNTGAQTAPGWRTNLEFNANKIRFHDSYVFPTTDGTAGQVLTTDGAEQLDWTTVSGSGSSTTINNNAVNRLITGSATANTLNGQGDLTYDGDHLLIEGTAGGTDDAVVNIKTDNSSWNTPQITLEDSDSKAVAIVGQNDSTAESDKLVFMLDPEGNHNATGAYTGDYGFYFNKVWSNVASTGIKMENRIFGAEEKFITSVFGDYSSAIGSQYDYKPFEFNAEKYEFNTRNAHGSVTETLNVRTSGITFHNNYTFPPTDGTANQVLQTDGSGNVTFATVAGTGTVTSIIAGTGLTGGTITGTGTVAIDSTVATLTGTQTLTNKTLTSVVLGGTTATASGNLIVSPATQILEVKGDGSSIEGQIKLNCHANTHGQTIKAQPHSASVTNTMLLPTGANSTLVSEISTSTLTNKSGAISQWTNDVNFLSTSSDANALADINYTTTPTEGQVLAWDNANQYWEPTTSSGGGATDLNSLTDVTITSVANNDLLMYNSTASKWQNTNLGVSVTPTLTGNSTASSALTYVLTVSNHATYDDPAYFLEVYTGSTKVVDNDDVTDNLDGTLSFTAPAAGTHEIRIRCQDFGDLQSEIATKALTTAAFGGTYRYWRVANFSGNPTNMGIRTIKFYGGTGQSGTAYPTNMTSGTAPSPFVATASYYYTPAGDTYAPWKAFDSVYNSWVWLLGHTGAQLATDWVQVDMGSNTSISSLTVGPWYSNQPSQFEILASNTGAFSGEETTIATITTTGNSSDVANVYNVG